MHNALEVEKNIQCTTVYRYFFSSFLFGFPCTSFACTPVFFFLGRKPWFLVVYSRAPWTAAPLPALIRTTRTSTEPCPSTIGWSPATRPDTPGRPSNDALWRRGVEVAPHPGHLLRLRKLFCREKRSANDLHTPLDEACNLIAKSLCWKACGALPGYLTEMLLPSR